jgi:N-acetylglucosamine-6-phosphate deacetylase
MLITNAQVYHPDRRFRHGWIQVDGARVVALGEGSPGPSAGPALDAAGQWVVPGFVDVHIHGSGGLSVNSPDPDQTRRLSVTLARHGVTAWLPTVAAEGPEETLTALQAVAAVCGEPGEGAEPVGIHMEGPFLNPARRGAFRPEVLRTPDLAYLQQLFDAAGDRIRRVTLAPELPGGHELIRYCRSRDAVPIMGHSDATFEEAMLAVAAGIGGVTHCFNAMRPIHHRQPGNVVAALAEGIPAEFIMDGIHVHPAVAKMAYRCLGASAFLIITDAVAPAGLPEGEYALYGQRLVLKEGQIRNPDGNLAGSVLTMDQGLRNAIRFLGVTLAEALPLATTTPLVGSGAEGRKGVLAPGRDADLVVLDHDLSVVRTMVRGRWVFERE